MTDEKRFDQLTEGDRIFWNGADNDTATVSQVLRNDETVWIRWTTDGAPHSTALRWKPQDRVLLAAPYPAGNPSGIHCVECTPESPCAACQDQIDADNDYDRDRLSIVERALADSPPRLAVFTGPDRILPNRQVWFAHYLDEDREPIETAYSTAMSLAEVIGELTRLNPGHLVGQRVQSGERYQIVCCGSTLPEVFDTWPEAVEEGRYCTHSTKSHRHEILTVPIWDVLTPEPTPEPTVFVYLIGDVPTTGTLAKYAHDVNQGDLCGESVSRCVWRAELRGMPSGMELVAYHVTFTAGLYDPDTDLATVVVSVLGEEASYTIDGRA